ncbi:hypothetical protein DdX_19295 [Ditylenchus destructor]|uniref:Uncharacterized protein n=1 Tax=Ditylenchus destructor TaxID=166010 RepID=A0AAD4MKP9_9BILA|nr:hypothetical protein DdX_19295 [Ditylenchus destructor]
MSSFGFTSEEITAVFEKVLNDSSLSSEQMEKFKPFLMERLSRFDGNEISQVSEIPIFNLLVLSYWPRRVVGSVSLSHLLSGWRKEFLDFIFYCLRMIALHIFWKKIWWFIFVFCTWQLFDRPPLNGFGNEGDEF